VATKTMRTLLCLLVPVLLASPAIAQQKAPERTIRVAALRIAGEHHTLWLRIGPGKDPVEVPLNTHSFSQPITYKGPARAVFYDSADSASAKEPPAPLAVATLSANTTLLVYSPTSEGNTYNVYPIPEEDFPFGSFRLINFSTVPIRATLGRKSATLKSGEAETFAYREPQDAIPIRFLAAVPDKEPRVIRQSTWSIIPSQRELVLFFPNPVNGLVTTRHFVDSQSPES
jgi:hypothetical protein